MRVTDNSNSSPEIIGHPSDSEDISYEKYLNSITKGVEAPIED